MSDEKQVSQLESSGAGKEHQPSTDVVLGVLEVAWGHLSHRCRRNMRAVCTGGRLLHDRLWTDLSVRLATPRAAKEASRIIMLDTGLMDPQQLTTSLTAVMQRGSRPMSLAVKYGSLGAIADHSLREKQLLSVLSCCAPRCGPCLTHLELSGCPPLTPAVAEAVAEAAPGLASLTLSFAAGAAKAEVWRGPSDPMDATAASGKEGDSAAAAAAAAAAADPAASNPLHILTVVGPRLRSLRLLRLGSCWELGAYAAIGLCTQLTELAVSVEDAAEGSFEVEGALLDTISQLHSLRALDFHYNWGSIYPTRGELSGHATRLQRLGALTALRRLRLCLPNRRRRDVLRSEQRHLETKGEEEAAACRAVWDRQQAALADALRCMAGLESLTVESGYVAAADVAPLTALTRLKVLSVLLPPPRPGEGAAAVAAAAAAPAPPPAPAPVPVPAAQPGAPQVGAAAAAAPTGSPAAAVTGARSSPAGSPRPAPPPPLPPNLRRLELSWGASPRLLATASRLPHLEAVLFHSAGDIHIVLDQSDVVALPEDGYCRLRPETIEAFGAAAKLLARVHRPRERTEYDTGIPGKVLTVTAEVHPAMVAPPEGELDGHAVWIRQLAPLREVAGVKLAMLAMQAVDVLSVAKTLKGARDLDLSYCSFPMAALPCLGPLPRLRTLRFNADHCIGNSSETVQSALLSMCLQVSTLRHLLVATSTWDLWPDWQQVERALGPCGRHIVFINTDVE